MRHTLRSSCQLSIEALLRIGFSGAQQRVAQESPPLALLMPCVLPSLRPLPLMSRVSASMGPALLRPYVLAPTAPVLLMPCVLPSMRALPLMPYVLPPMRALPLLPCVLAPPVLAPPVMLTPSCGLLPPPMTLVMLRPATPYHQRRPPRPVTAPPSSQPILAPRPSCRQHRHAPMMFLRQAQQRRPVAARP
jgi:hypothetical protein